jgi:hypothetical protein
MSENQEMPLEGSNIERITPADGQRPPDSQERRIDNPIFSLLSRSSDLEADAKVVEHSAPAVNLKPDIDQTEAEVQAERLRQLGLEPEAEDVPLAVRSAVDGGLAPFGFRPLPLP